MHKGRSGISVRQLSKHSHMNHIPFPLGEWTTQGVLSGRMHSPPRPLTGTDALPLWGSGTSMSQYVEVEASRRFTLHPVTLNL